MGRPMERVVQKAQVQGTALRSGMRGSDQPRNAWALSIAHYEAPRPAPRQRPVGPREPQKRLQALQPTVGRVAVAHPKHGPHLSPALRERGAAGYR